jgi:hypothetical protein
MGHKAPKMLRVGLYARVSMLLRVHWAATMNLVRHQRWQAG